MNVTDLMDYAEGMLVTRPEAAEFAKEKVRECLARCPQIPQQADLYYQGKVQDQAEVKRRVTKIRSCM